LVKRYYAYLRNNLETARGPTPDLAKAVAAPTDNWPPPRPDRRHAKCGIAHSCEESGLPKLGRWKGFYSIRINDHWRVVFRFESGNASDVRVVDYH